MTALQPQPQSDGSQPQDSRIDRREFLRRMTIIAGAVSIGALAPQIVASAAPASPMREAPSPFLRSGQGYARTIRPEALADITELTISEAASLIRSRRLKPSELLQAYLDRIESFESVYKAFNLVRAADALAEASGMDSAPHMGLLHGIPLAVKDNYYTEGILTTANSHIFQSFVPGFDATVVARLKAAGGIVLGKTQMGPLATTRATTPDGVVTTVNAWTPDLISYNPGGSSTGSATAVAGRLATSSIGTQTGGSITNPSNQQGLTGLKPTHGRASLYGVIPLTYSRDHPGPLARDAMDAAIMLQAMAGPDPNDPRTLGLPPVPNYIQAATPVGGRDIRLRWPTTVGVTPGYTDGTTPMALARAEMLRTFERLGARVVEVPLSAEWAHLTSTPFNNVRLPERSEPFLEYLRQDVRLFGVSLNSWMQGLFLSGDEFVKGQRAKLRLLTLILDELFSKCDVIVQTGVTPFDSVGLPLIGFPIGFGPAPAPLPPDRKVPLGGLLGARPYGEERLLALVAAYQAVTDFHLQRPPDPPVSVSTFGAAAPLILTAEEAEQESE